MFCIFLSSCMVPRSQLPQFQSRCKCSCTCALSFECIDPRDGHAQQQGHLPDPWATRLFLREPAIREREQYRHSQRTRSRHTRRTHVNTHGVDTCLAHAFTRPHSSKPAFLHTLTIPTLVCASAQVDTKPMLGLFNSLFACLSTFLYTCLRTGDTSEPDLLHLGCAPRVAEEERGTWICV